MEGGGAGGEVRGIKRARRSSASRGVRLERDHDETDGIGTLFFLDTIYQKCAPRSNPNVAGTNAVYKEVRD